MSKGLRARREEERGVLEKSRGWSRGIMSSAKSKAIAWQKCSSNLPGDEIYEPEGIISGNSQIYSVLSKVIDLPLGRSVSEMKVIKELRYFQQVADSRRIPGSTGVDTFSSIGCGDQRTILVLTHFSEEIQEMYSSSSKSLERSIKDKSKIHKSEGNGSIGLVTYGAVVCLKIDNFSAILSTDHFHKLVDSLCKYRNYLIMSLNTVIGDGPVGTNFLRRASQIGVDDPERLGEGCKAARNLLVARLTPSKIFSKTAESLLKSTYPEWKQNMSETFMDIIENAASTVYEQLIVSHFYKYIPHPDVDIVECFRSTKGCKSANPVDRVAGELMRGVLKKSFFMASLKNGEALRIESGDPYLELESLKPSPDYSSMDKVPSERWISVRFCKSRRYSTFLGVDLRTLDKSHCKDLPDIRLGPKETLDKDYLLGKRKTSVEKVSLFESDLTLKYIKDEEPSAKQSSEYFKKLVKIHERVEEKLGRFPTVDEIEEHFDASPEDFHMVSTEGKYGETHKAVTRMFYLASPHIKKFLSLVERLVKDITHGQAGNSITKSYKSRQQDLRMFVHSVHGPKTDIQPVYLSFDMSEFSKKFPHANLRILGETLADITGDESLRRLDIAFRSAAVAHRTRGLSTSYAGVDGGFEGFLNFGWTTLHVAIMVLSLKEASVQGVILAYSDDGVLYFLVKGTESEMKERIRQAVTSIQETYSKLGLVFHLGKTLVSTTTFEYLGEIGDDGRLIDTWVKPLSGFGVRDRDDSLSTLGSECDAIVGQVTATISKGFPGGYLEPFMYHSLHLRLNRMCSDLTVEDTAGIMIMPRSSGGLGVPCTLCMSIQSDSDPLSEFVADCNLMSKTFPHLVKKMVSFIITNISSPSESKCRLLMGNSLCTDVGSLSGAGTMIEAARILRDKLGKVESMHPVSSKVGSEIVGQLRTVVGITPSITRCLIEASPKMIEYTAMMQEGRSKGAAKLLGKETIRRLQHKESRSSKITLQAYKSHETTECTVIDLLKIANKSLSLSGLSTPKPSIRSMLRRSCRGGHSLSVIINLVDDAKVGLGRKRPGTSQNLSYLEPTMSSKSVADRIVFESEQSRDNKIPYRLMKVVTGIIRHNSSVSMQISNICNILGSDIPDLAPFNMAGIDRLRSWRSKPDITLSIPAIVKARSTVIMGSYIASMYQSGSNINRTTLEYIALAATSEDISASRLLSKPPKLEKDVYYYCVNSLLEHLSDTKLTSIKEPPSVKPIGNVQHEIKILEKFTREMKDEMLFDSLQSIENIEVSDMNMLIEFFANKCYSQIAFRKGGYMDMDKIESTYSGTTSVSLNLEIHRMVAIKLIVKSYNTHPTLQGSKAEVMEDLSAMAGGLSESISKHVLGIPDQDVYDYIRGRDLADSLFTSTKLYVIDDGRYHGDDRVIRNVKKILAHTIKDVYNVANGTNGKKWQTQYATDQEKLKRTSHGLSTDMVLDILSVGYDSSRRSSHRATLHNKSTFEIIAYQMLTAILRDHTSHVDEPVISTVSQEDSDSDDEANLDLGAPDPRGETGDPMPPEDVEFLLRMSSWGPDHKKIISSRIPIRSNRRSMIYAKTPKLGNRIHDRSARWALAVDMQHIYYNVISKVLGTKLRLISRSSSAELPANLIGRISSLPSPRYHRCPMMSADTGYIFSDDAMKIAWAHVKMLCVTEDIDSITTKNIPATLIDYSVENLLFSPNGASLLFGSYKKNSMTMFIEACRKPSDACCIVAHNSTMGNISTSVIKSDDVYYAVGAVLVQEDLFDAITPYEGYIEENAARFAMPCNNSDHLGSILADSGSYMHARIEARSRSYPFEDYGLTIKQQRQTNVIVKDNSMIAIAAALASGGSTYAQSYFASLLVEEHLRGGTLDDAREQFKDSMHMVEIGTKKMRNLLVRGIKLSASSVRSYFYYNPVSSSTSLDVCDYSLPCGVPTCLMGSMDFQVVFKHSIPISELLRVRIDTVDEGTQSAVDLFEATLFRNSNP
jgi:hypothetical protein